MENYLLVLLNMIELSEDLTGLIQANQRELSDVAEVFFDNSRATRNIESKYRHKLAGQQFVLKSKSNDSFLFTATI